MYVFAAVVLLALAVAKLVDLIVHFGKVPTGFRLTLALLAGLGLTWLTDYSIFAGWEIAFREAWMGPVVTGLVIGGTATVWHEILGVISSYGRRVQDQATEIETRIPRAA